MINLLVLFGVTLCRLVLNCLPDQTLMSTDSTNLGIFIYNLTAIINFGYLSTCFAYVLSLQIGFFTWRFTRWCIEMIRG